MPRKNQFHPDCEPHRDNPALELQPSQVSGPISFLNPTRAHFKPRLDNNTTQPERQKAQENLKKEEKAETTDDAVSIRHIWRSRDNRKGRHLLHITYRNKTEADQRHELPRSTTTVRATLRGVLRMFTFFPYWDVSWWVASIFTWGSVIWVINAFFVWLPLADPSTEFPSEISVGGGVTAFIGATVFEIGSLLLMLEAVNENQTGCFGWAVETVLDRDIRRISVRPSPHDEQRCQHHHSQRHSFLVREDDVDDDGNGQADGEEGKTTKRSFRWLPTATELREHYFHELGFLASLVQLIGATIFWIAGFTGLPGILDHMSDNLTDGVYWTPQIVGGIFFVLSGLLFTLEVQPRWYIPAPKVLGWYIGLWNFIGGIGFALCGALGPATFTSSGVSYQSSLATFWGSWAFLIGSAIQWYESLEKFPVEES